MVWGAEPSTINAKGCGEVAAPPLYGPTGGLFSDGRPFCYEKGPAYHSIVPPAVLVWDAKLRPMSAGDTSHAHCQQAFPEVKNKAKAQALL